MIQGKKLVVVMPAPNAETTLHTWLLDIRKRLRLALAATLSVTTLYVEGVLNHYWIYLFRGTGMVGNPLIAVALLVPVAGYIAMPRSTVWLRNLVIIIAISCCLVSGLDVLLRLWNGRGYASRRFYPNLPIVLRWDPNLNVKGQTFGDIAGMVGDPMLREPRPLIFQTDAAGFRNTHRGDGIDLLVLGDSFGAGVGTTQDRIFARLLETQYGWRVYSLSYPGSPYHEYINFLIESPSLSFHPNAHVLWVYYTGNDLIEDYGDIWDPAALPWQDGVKAWMTTYYNFRSRSPLHLQK